MDKPFIVNVADALATARPARAIAIDSEAADTPWPDTAVISVEEGQSEVPREVLIDY
jgi:hypothetical protein